MALVGTALADHSWGSYHWAKTSSEVARDVGDNVNSDWDKYLDGAIADWNLSPVILLTKVPGGTTPSSCQPTAGRIEACNASYGSTGWLGIAQIWVSGGHITQAITKVNDTYFNTATYNTPAWRQLVVCQEIAHDFGLAHQDEGFGAPNLGSCMDYTNDPDGGGSYGPSNEHPNAHDFEQLLTIYSHTEGSGGGGKPCRGKKCPNQNALDHAPPFSQASRANGSVYVDHLPNGGRRITHVFWTPFGE